MKVAAAEKANQAHTTLTNSAFIGWQVASSFGGKKIGTFQAYLKRLGLTRSEHITPQERENLKKRAAANAERVRQAFKRKGAPQ